MTQWNKVVIAAGYDIKPGGDILGKKGQVMKPAIGKNGYLHISCQIKVNIPKTFSVHRLIALHFVPNPRRLPHVNHKDGNKLNNHHTNLEWCDPYYNMKHAYATGLVKRRPMPTGADNTRSKMVSQYDLDGNLIATYGSGGEAGRMSGHKDYCIRSACVSRSNLHGGFRWKYTQKIS